MRSERVPKRGEVAHLSCNHTIWIHTHTGYGIVYTERDQLRDHNKVEHTLLYETSKRPTLSKQRPLGGKI